jgi:prepilin-type N-terminal cleavage/methylation domain-containing protein
MNTSHIQLKTKRSGRGGFTLIETLVAIAVLMISIAGPLVVASKGLTSALFARDQLMASYLAQETVELIKNTRDNNLAASQPWLTGITTFSGNTYCTSANSACDLTAVGLLTNRSCVGTTGGCQLYYDPEIGYNSNAEGTPTIFKRYYFLEDVPGPANESGEMRLKVVVTWNHGTLPNEFVLMSVLENDKR